MKNIDSVRAELAALQAEDKVLDRQRLSRDDVREAIRASVDHTAATWESRLGLMHRRIAGGTRAGEAIAQALDPETQRAAPDTVNAVALFGLLGADRVAEALSAQIDEHVPAGPNAAARAARRVELAAEMLRLETLEEALIVASEATATPIARRPESRPQVVLAYLGPDAAEGAADDAPTTPTPAAEIEAQQERASKAAGAKRRAAATQSAESEYLKRRRE